MSRTMLIHSSMRSPQGTTTAELWLVDIYLTVCLYNWIPREDSGMSTYELWIRSSFLTSKNILSTCHTWGAPSYVLEPKIYKGRYHIPKCAPHSRRRIFLGFSRIYSTIVGLILNLHSRSISPQFYIVFNDRFTTIASAHTEEVVPNIWTNMITNPNAWLHLSLEEDTNPTLADKWLATE